MKISIAAVLKRINRRLVSDGERIRKVRGERARMDLGDFWVQDVNRNLPVAMHVDPVRIPVMVNTWSGGR